LSHMIQERAFPDSRTSTTDVDLPELRQFPAAPAIRIHENDGTSFVPKSCSPGPSYHPMDCHPKHDYRSHRIECRHDRRKEGATPSPVAYRPTDPGRSSCPNYSMPRAPVKRFHDEKVDLTPGPGQYQIGPELRRSVKWTERLRVAHAQTLVEPVMVESWDSANRDFPDRLAGHS
jgi:hypothetical protein